MRWRKIGKVFDPTAVELPGRCEEFAQGPQVLQLGDVIRVYFSTREKDETGKYLSHVAFVDLDRDLRVLGVSPEPALSPGGLGCYDEHGVFPLHVLKTSDRLLGYISGVSRRRSVSLEGSIGVAISEDEGLTFQRLGDGPVVTSSLKEPFLMADPFVRLEDGTFHMWYIFGVAWKLFENGGAPDRVYKIGHAVSDDGVHWHKPEEGRQVVASVLGPDESQAMPSVVKIGDSFHMFFCFRESFDFRTNKERGYRIGHAVSEDLWEWRRDDAVAALGITEGDWDSDMLCYPHVFAMDGRVYMLYNGNEFGRLGFGAAVLEW